MTPSPSGRASLRLLYLALTSVAACASSVAPSGKDQVYWVESATNRPAVRLLLPASPPGAVAWRLEEVNNKERNAHLGIDPASLSVAPLLPLTPRQPPQSLATHLAVPIPEGFTRNPLRLIVVPVFSAESKGQTGLMQSFAGSPAMLARWEKLRASATAVSVASIAGTGVTLIDCTKHDDFVRAISQAGTTSTPALAEQLNQLIAARANSAVIATALREVPVLLIVWAESSVKLPDGATLVSPGTGLPIGVRGLCVNIADGPLRPVAKMREFIQRSGLAYETVARDAESGQRKMDALVDEIFSVLLPNQLSGWSTVVLESGLALPGPRRTFAFHGPGAPEQVTVDLSAGGQRGSQAKLRATLRRNLASGAESAALARLDEDYLPYLDATSRLSAEALVAEHLESTFLPALLSTRQFSRASEQIAKFRARLPSAATSAVPRLTLQVENGILSAIKADIEAANFPSARELISLLREPLRAGQMATLLFSEGLYWLGSGEQSKGEAALENWFEVDHRDKTRLVTVCENLSRSADEPSLLRWAARLRAVEPKLTQIYRASLARWLAESSSPAVVVSRAAALDDVELASECLTAASPVSAASVRAAAWLHGAMGKLEAWREIAVKELAQTTPATEGAQLAALPLAELARVEATIPLAVAYSKVATRDHDIARQAMIAARALPFLADWFETVQISEISPATDAELDPAWKAWLSIPGRLLVRRHPPTKDDAPATWSIVAAAGPSHVCRLVWNATPDRDAVRLLTTLAMAPAQERSAPVAALRLTSFEAALPAALMLISEATRLSPSTSGRELVPLFSAICNGLPEAVVSHAFIYTRNPNKDTTPGGGAVDPIKPRNLPASVAGNTLLNEAAAAFVLPPGDDGIIEMGIPLMTPREDAAAGGRPYFEATGTLRLGIKSPANR